MADPDGADPRRDAWLPPELRGRAADVELLNNSEDPVTDVLIFLSRVGAQGRRAVVAGVIGQREMRVVDESTSR